MKRKILLFCMVVFFISSVLAIFNSPYSWHDADEVIVSIDGYSMTLQDAIDNNILVDKSNVLIEEDFETNLSKGHDADEINIYLGASNKYTNEGQISLGDAISNKISLCRSHNFFTSLIFDFINHGSGEVRVIVKNESMSLQEAINSAKFCSYEWKNEEFPVCSDAVCGDTLVYRDVWCERSDEYRMPSAEEDFCVEDKPAESQYCYGWMGDSWVGCDGACGECVQTRNVWCARCDARSTNVDESNCISDSKISETQVGDFGSNTCGWSGWSTTSVCSYTGSCGAGAYKRVRSCNVPGHCAGDDYDWSGSACYAGSSNCHCKYKERCSSTPGIRERYPVGSCRSSYGCSCGTTRWADGRCAVAPPSPIPIPVPGGDSCFPAGTKIAMGDGSVKNIEDVKIGDNILSFDEAIQEQRIGEVLELESPIRDHMCEILFEDDSSLKLTDEHPIYTEYGWKSINPSNTLLENANLDFVSELSIGDRVLFEDNNFREIVSIDCWKEIVKTYNLKSVSGYNNFYAGGVLVHNKVLCTETYRQGYIPDDWLEADHKFAEEYVDEITTLGYHSWAKPFVRAMQSSVKLSSYAIPLNIEWTKHIAYKMGAVNEDSEIGKTLIDVGMPFCKKIGNILIMEGYSSDNEYEFDDEFIKELFSKYIDKGTFDLDSLSSESEKEQFRSDLEDFFSEIESEFYSQKYL